MKTMAQLKYHFGLKMRMYPNSKQKQLIKLNSDAFRATYNKLVAIDQELYQLKKVKVMVDTVQQRIKQLELRKKTARNLANHFRYLLDKNIDSLCLADARLNYQKAWRQYRKVHHAGTPKFRKKSYCEKYQTNCQYGKNATMDMFSGNAKFLDATHFQLPKLGKVRVSGSQKRLLNNKRDIRIGTITISKDACERYFVSLQLASDTPFVQVPQKASSQVGVDLNTDNFLTDSNGKQIANPRYYRTIKNKLAKAQRILSRRQLRAKKEHRNLRDAKNYQKQRKIVAQLHEKVRNQRNNFLHVITTALINSHDLVVAENLRSSNMLKNHALAMSIADVGWRDFLGKMEYKAALYGRTFITVNPKNTTQTCHNCGHIMGQNGTAKLTLKDRQWTCPKCDVHHIRDVNAAKNILAKGLAK